ncbi:TlpA family protein disulfide reductase [Microbacterium karelineae]|uniref:TlpA family protein disulfide reductase n=1 Tax=Microbacterium karelineae TaxID=2654283 RepID=UPI0012E9BE25|nr:thioredoxin family protein [Microbacterium karelineae]
MSPLTAVFIALGVVLVAVGLGLTLRARDGRVRETGQGDVTAQALDVDPSAFGTRATLVQFSTEMCARCPATRRLLTEIADERDGVAHVDVDLTDRADLARDFHVIQTPTTLVIDGARVARARIGGAPNRESVLAALDGLGARDHA